MFSNNGFSGFGFGGFNTSGLDQSFSIDGQFLATQSEHTEFSAQSQKRGPLYPFTVSLIQRSFHRHPGSIDAQFFGERVVDIRLVGLIRNLNVDEVEEKWSFNLDDATGRIQVVWCASSLRGWEEAPGPSPWMKQQLDKIKENTYASVRGRINTLGTNLPTIMAVQVKPVDVFEEVFFHQIQVAQEIVRKLHPSPTPETTPAVKSRELITQTVTNGTLHTAKSSSTSVGPYGVGISHNLEDSTKNTHLAQQPFGEGQENPVMTASVQGFNFEQFHKQNMQPLSFYDSSAQQQSSAQGDGNSRQIGEAIINAMRTLSGVKPNGMTEEEILMILVTKGINVDPETIQKECHALVSRGRAYENQSGRWKLTNF